MTAIGPDGRQWRIKRHWLSLRPRWRGGDNWGEHWWDIPDVGNPFDLFDDGPFAILFAVVILFLIGLIFFPVFALVIELIIVVLALVITLAAKVLFRRPWIVLAHTDGHPPEDLRWKVVGWRRTHEVMEGIRASLEAGVTFLSPHAEPIVVADTTPGAPVSIPEMKEPPGMGGS